MRNKIQREREIGIEEEGKNDRDRDAERDLWEGNFEVCGISW